MLRPQDGPTRERKVLDGVWDFVLDAAGAGRRERWWTGPLVGSRSMPVPASYNDIVPGPTFRDHVGDAWYQRTVHVPAGWAAAASCCASTRPPIAAPSSSTTWRSSRTRAATRRSRST